MGELVGSLRVSRHGVFRSFVIVAALTLLTTACHRSHAPAPLPPADACIVTASSLAVDSAAIVVTSPVNVQNAPRATTWGERFVFDLANDSAPRLDCRGRPASDAAGPYRIRDVGRSTLLLDRVAGARGPRLAIHVATETSARDLVDAGVDLLVTDSPALAAYAATRGDVTSVSLGWDRTWVVAAPRGPLAIDSSVTFRSGLARDVVRDDARASEGPHWWSDTAGCSTTIRSTPAPIGGARVAYPRDEAVARALAERLVAVLGGRATAAGLAPNAFASALASGSEVAYVFPLRRKTVDRCRSMNELLERASWLGGRGAITALIDTRLHAVVRRNRLNLAFTWDSTIAIVSGRP